MRCVKNQGAAFAAELVEAGGAEALIPLLDPRFELVRIGSFVSCASIDAGEEGGDAQITSQAVASFSIARTVGL